MKLFFLLLFFSSSACVAQTYKLPGTSFRLEHRDYGLTPHGEKIATSNGETIVNYGVYTSIKHFSGDLFIVGSGYNKKGGYLPKAYGIYDAALRKEIVPCDYELIEKIGCVAKFRDKNDGIGFFNTAGQDLGNRYSYAAGSISDSLKPAFAVSVKTGKKEYRRGFIDRCAKPITEMIYEDGGNFENGYAMARREGKYLFIDSTGKEIIPPKYVYLTSFSQGVAAFSISGGYNKKGEFADGKWGIINTKGEEIIPAKYEAIPYVWSFTVKDGKTQVKENGNWITIEPLSAKGGVVKSEQPELKPYAKNGKKDKVDDDWGYGVKWNDYVIAPKYNYAGDFKNGFAVVGRRSETETKDEYGNKAKILYYGIINAAGEEIIPLKYKSIARYGANKWLVYEGTGTSGSKWNAGVLSDEGKVILPLVFSYIGPPSEGLIAAGAGNKRGFIDETGKWIINAGYEFVYNFKDGISLVKYSKDQFYYIDKKAKPAVPGYFRYAEEFKNGKAVVWTATDAWGRPDGKKIIDLNGKVIESFAMNSAPEKYPAWETCNLCGGGGGRFETVTKTGSSTNVDNYNANAPGKKVITTTTSTWNETKRVGDCFRCGGSGKVQVERLRL